MLYLPPDQPVFTSHPVAPCFFIFSASIAAYLDGCNIMNAAPKQAENVACGSFTPSSVPATWFCNKDFKLNKIASLNIMDRMTELSSK